MTCNQTSTAYVAGVITAMLHELPYNALYGPSFHVFQFTFPFDYECSFQSFYGVIVSGSLPLTLNPKGCCSHYRDVACFVESLECRVSVMSRSMGRFWRTLKIEPAYYRRWWSSIKQGPESPPSTMHCG